MTLIDRPALDDISPLDAIETSVREQLQHQRFANGSGADRSVVAAMIDSEIARWNTDAARGARRFPIADPDAISERALRNLLGYGPLEPLLADDDVWEIMINSPDSIFVKRHRGPSGLHHEVFHNDEHVVRTMARIVDDAHSAHRTLDPAEGLQDAQLESGARLHIVHGELAYGGHMMVNIRKFTGVALRSLHELVAMGTLTDSAAKFLVAAVRAPASIVFAGAPGSGKTTLMSCCAAELDPSLRAVVAEEVFEADLALPNVAQMQTRAARPDRPAVDLRRLVAGFLRMAPDVAIVGEVRDREALPLLLTLSSGVKGFTTIHAGSPRQALSRLRFLAQLADTGSPVPANALHHLVSEAVDVVVHSRRGRDGVEVTSIVAIEEPANLESGTFTTTEVFRRDLDGILRFTGQFPSRLTDLLASRHIDLHTLLSQST
jgi:pilus assembly protein CpaF